MYQKINKFGLIGAIGISALMLLISLFVYNATTYIKTDDGKWQDIEVYEANKAEEKATFKAAQKKLTEAKDRDLASRGIKKKERTPEELKAEVEYKAALDEKAQQEEERELYEAEKVGETSALLWVAYFLIFVALSAIVIFTIFSAIDKAKNNNLKPAIWTAGAALGVLIGIIRVVVRRLFRSGGESSTELMDNVFAIEDWINVDFLLTTTWVLLIVAIAGVFINEITKAFK